MLVLMLDLAMVTWVTSGILTTCTSLLIARALLWSTAVTVVSHCVRVALLHDINYVGVVEV